MAKGWFFFFFFFFFDNYTFKAPVSSLLVRQYIFEVQNCNKPSSNVDTFRRVCGYHSILSSFLFVRYSEAGVKQWIVGQVKHYLIAVQ
jgi:hypothetical protein